MESFVWGVFNRGCLVGETMIASGLLNFRCYCALRLEGKSQVGTIPNCVSSEGCSPRAEKRCVPVPLLCGTASLAACSSYRGPKICQALTHIIGDWGSHTGASHADIDSKGSSKQAPPLFLPRWSAGRHVNAAIPFPLFIHSHNHPLKKALHRS